MVWLFVINVVGQKVKILSTPWINWKNAIQKPRTLGSIMANSHPGFMTTNEAE